ncbi:MAG TPA: PAS domain-containing protein [Victivallales bacterium]|nr:PAS domain-containing protein [Victivallales bacterium]
MKLDLDKIQDLREDKGLSINGLSKLLGVCRTTLWKWIKGLLTPNEDKVRKLADVLEVPVNKISDLDAARPKSNQTLNTLASSLNSFGDSNMLKQQQKFDYFTKSITDLNKEMVHTNIITKALLSSTDIIFYIKDLNLNYITANNAFIDTLKLNSEFCVAGKKDEDLITLSEAERNSKEDSNVITSGQPVLNREGVIPGSRRRKWGIISKHPIYDNENKIAGLVASFVDITEKKRKEKDSNV